MLELFYAIYKNQNIHEILYTIVAISLVNGIGKIENDHVRVERIFFPKKIRRLLSSIEINDGNRITWDDIKNLKEYFLSELKKCGYISRIPLIGHIKSFKYHRKMHKEKYLIDESIKLYIDTRDRTYLDEIDTRIKNIRFNFPASDIFGSFYEDTTEMLDDALKIDRGMLTPKEYKHYYAVSGEKYSILK